MKETQLKSLEGKFEIISGTSKIFEKELEEEKKKNIQLQAAKIQHEEQSKQFTLKLESKIKEQKDKIEKLQEDLS